MTRTAVAADSPMASPPVAGNRRPPDGAELTVACYHNDVPDFIEADLQRLYSSIYSSLQQFHIHADGGDTSTYILRENGEVAAVFLFQRHGDRIRVINEVLEVGEEDLHRFAFYIFGTFPDVSVISFKAVRTDVTSLPYPFQRSNHLEDIVLTLPSSEEEYRERLGKGTRRNMKRHLGHLNERFPDLRFEVRTGEEIDAATVDAIIGMNRARMAGKNKSSLIDTREAERIRILSRSCGLVGAVWIDGQIRAGTISFRCGNDYYLNVIAHDPDFDEYWLGILCCYWTICECIARRGREFHFLWGRYDYKTMLRGEVRNLDNILIYRSRISMAFHWLLALRFTFGGWRRRLSLHLHDLKRENGWLSRLAAGLRQIPRRAPVQRPHSGR